MKAITTVLFGMLISLMLIACKTQTESTLPESQELSKAEKIEVFYFHYSRRCATCNAVESVAQEAIIEYYGDAVKFISLNLDETEGETKGKELEVSGQTLLVMADDIKINLTNEAFMNARTNPDTLKQVIKEKIDPFL